MSARKIRQTQVGLVAMPADRDERTVAGEHLATDPDLCTAFAELFRLSRDVQTALERWADEAGTDADYVTRVSVADAIDDAWDIALDDAAENNADKVRVALQRAAGVARAHDLSTEHEDAALAMLPPVAGRRAA